MAAERPAVLCLHGLTSTPYEWRPLGDALRAAGYTFDAPVLVGHGTRPEALAHTRWPDWLGAARRAFDALAAEHAQVVLVGMSMGALCATVLAHERGARVAGLAAMALPLELSVKSQAVVELARRAPLIHTLMPYITKKSGPDVSDPAVAAAMPSYDRIPLAAAASMVDGQKAALARLPRLSCPVLLQHGRDDHVAPVRNARKALGMLRTRHKRAIIYPNSWHILPLDADHEQVTADVLAFVADPKGFTGSAPA